MNAESVNSRRSPFGAIVVFIVAALLYLATIASLADVHGSDAAGRGLAAAFAAIFGTALWFALALLLLLAYINGRMPGWAAALMLVLHPLGGFACFAAGQLYAEKGGWPFLIVALLPPLAAFYALAMRIPKFADALPRTPVSAAVSGIIALLSLAPLVIATIESSSAK